MEHVYLHGSEYVRSAGVSMSSAASDMIRAANMISESVYQFQEQINKIEQLLERAIMELPQGDCT